jgi:hypothetical protein
MMKSDDLPRAIEDWRSRRARQCIGQILNSLIIRKSHNIVVESNMFLHAARMLNYINKVVDGDSRIR